MSVLTFYRIKPWFTDPDKIVSQMKGGRSIVEAIRLNDGSISKLYIKRTKRHRPSWLEFFGSHLHLGSFPVETASLAAVLVVRQPDSFYALTFGYGASLLDADAIEERFGLRATLNAVEPAKLRSIDHKRLEAISRHTREQLSREGDLGQFGLDIDRDLLTAVTGAPTDPVFGTRMSGSDQLTVAANISLETLKPALVRYAELANETTYARNFPWVDNIQHVSNPSLHTSLDKELAVHLMRGSEDFWLSPPEVVVWSTTKGFKYRQSRHARVYQDLSLADYFTERGGADGLQNGTRLRSDLIFHVRAEDENSRHTWSAMRCLVGELDF